MEGIGRLGKRCCNLTEQWFCASWYSAQLTNLQSWWGREKPCIISLCHNMLSVTWEICTTWPSTATGSKAERPSAFPAYEVFLAVLLLRVRSWSLRSDTFQKWILFEVLGKASCPQLPEKEKDSCYLSNHKELQEIFIRTENVMDG